MCAVLPVKRVSDSEWTKLQQVGNVKREPRIWLHITLVPNTKFLRNKILLYDIFVNCNWVDTWWQQYSTHLHTNST